MRIRRGGASSEAPLGDLITGVVLVRYCWGACRPQGTQDCVITGDILKARLYALVLYECQNGLLERLASRGVTTKRRGSPSSSCTLPPAPSSSLSLWSDSLTPPHLSSPLPEVFSLLPLHQDPWTWQPEVLLSTGQTQLFQRKLLGPGR